MTLMTLIKSNIATEALDMLKMLMKLIMLMRLMKLMKLMQLCMVRKLLVKLYVKLYVKLFGEACEKPFGEAVRKLMTLIKSNIATKALDILKMLMKLIMLMKLMKLCKVKKLLVRLSVKLFGKARLFDEAVHKAVAEDDW